MKKIILLLSFLPAFVWAQNNLNTDDGLAVEGYDVVSYFNNKKPLEGKKAFQVKHDGATYRFSSEKNKELFTQNPEKYLPQYGGWCAYAMGTSGDKVNVDPETFEIRNGKLYLFYNRFFTNTFESWIEENPAKLIPVANKNWQKITHSK